MLAEISPNLDLTIDYGFLWFLAAPIYWLLTQIDSLVGNYGVSIILLTLVVKALFYKLSETQYKSMAGMRRVMPKMQQIKDRYGDDRMGLQKATMDLYKKEKKLTLLEVACQCWSKCRSSLHFTGYLWKA